MTIAFLYMQLILTTIFTGLACTLPGTFLILRGTSLISDAISHAIFLGIVITFLIFKQFYAPVLFAGAMITALCTIWLIEKIIASKRLESDAAIGIIFPFLFAVATVLINLYAQNIHLDIDAVLMGELVFTPFFQILWDGKAIGSYALWTMITIFLINLMTIIIMYKKLLITTFDSGFAHTIQYNTQKIHWILMTLTSITILGAFEATGAILVIAFIIIPPATAYLICNSVKNILIISCLISILGIILGCLMANILATSFAASITTIYSLLFALTYLSLFIFKKNNN
jgi:manganese/zinc/iron transport system permease protein